MKLESAVVLVAGLMSALVVRSDDAVRFDAGRLLMERFPSKELKVSDNIDALERGAVPDYAVGNVIRWLEFNRVDCGVLRQRYRPVEPSLGHPLTERKGFRLGFMLDISRSRVPTMETLRNIVDALAVLGYGEFQLYNEVSFAYRGHREMWEGWSPMTADEIRELDEYCWRRGIVLTPNQNSFGHLEKLFRHARYLPLAEAPNGFTVERPPLGKSGPAALCATDPRSIEFLGGLYDELFPLFAHADRVHVGCDEVWDIYGSGTRSAEKIRRYGVPRVYADFVLRVFGLCRERRRRPMFWADMMLLNFDHLRDIPKDALPIVWGYGGEDSRCPGYTCEFEGRCLAMKRLGLEFYVAPSDNVYGTFFGSYRRAKSNIDLVVAAGRKFDAKGLLLTSWGDGGHRAPWIMSLPALVYAAGAARGEALSDGQVAETIDALTGCRIGAALVSLGSVQDPESPRSAEVCPNRKEVAAFRAALAKADAFALNRKVCGGYEMLSVGADIAEARLNGSYESRKSDFARRFADAWLKDSRLGGLSESLQCGIRLPVPHDLVIAVPPDAARTVRIAASEFAKYYEGVTGRRLPVVASSSPGLGAVRIGYPCPALPFDAENDAYEVRGNGTGLEISGSNGRSVLYGVYDFFRRQCGCRWFWDGDVVPKANAVSFDGVEIRERARFRYRGCQYFAHRGLTRFQAEQWGPEDWRKEIDWCVKNRLNVFFMHLGSEDFFQRAFPDVVEYPDPSKTQPCDSKEGYDQRSPFWSLEFRSSLRRATLAYARDRGMEHPEKIGPVTHWLYRTPQAFVEAMKPSIMPQIDSYMTEPSGQMWDVRETRWFDAYWQLTEAAVSGYGEPGLFFNPGFDERTVYSNAAENAALKVDVIRRFNEESLRRRPTATVVVEGWDFFHSWRPNEMESLLSCLDPKRTVIWDFTADDIGLKPPYPWIPICNVYTNWGVVGKFPYTFGTMLAANRGNDIRGQYGVIRERERAMANDPFCKGYLIWPECSHSDIFAWRYFTDNCWRLSERPVDSVLADFCRDRYGCQSGAFLEIWRRTLPISQTVDWLGTAVAVITDDGPSARNDPSKWLAADSLASPEESKAVLAALAEIGWEGAFVRRDSVDLARTVLDRGLIWAYGEMMRTYSLCRQGRADSSEVAASCSRAVALAEAFADVLALHTDFSLSESLDRMNAVERVRNPDFEHVLFENSAAGYCLSHQAEYARSWYLPQVRELAKTLVERSRAGDFSPLPEPADYRAELRRRAHPIRDFAPNPEGRTAMEFRRVMLKAQRAFN